MTAAWRGEPNDAPGPRSLRWVRPPYALDEPDFLRKCTGCGDCGTACPHQTIFALPAASGWRAEGTPALNLLSRSCHMCDGWPCVAACETGALAVPDHGNEELPELPKLARAEIDSDACIAYLGPECGACAHACPVPGALHFEMGIRPVIRADLCTGCALCREACVVETKAISISPIVHTANTPEPS
nr:4Fe-4S dicluster domain-containing protein [Ruegeria sp. HKCCD8929]